MGTSRSIPRANAIKHLGFVLLTMVVTQMLCLSVARAACSADTKAHLTMAIDSYKEWETYSKETADTSDELAKSEWDNFEHEMDWIQDHGDIRDCLGSDTQLLYRLYSARYDTMTLEKADAMRQVGVEGSSDADLKALVNTSLDVYYLQCQHIVLSRIWENQPE